MSARPRVLVVEDDETVLDTLCAILDEHYDIVRAARVAEARTALARQRVDVVLLDYRLSDGSGHSVADQTSVPVVWMTGDPEGVRALGADSRPLLLKPFKVCSVLAALSQALAAARDVRAR